MISSGSCLNGNSKKKLAPVSSLSCAPIETPWVGQCRALVYGALGGQAGAGAAADILTGKLCPCGKLSQTWAQAHDDTPAKANFGGEGWNVEYREGLYVGYRYYQTAGVPVAFPFGYGLSYTTFEYSDLKADEKAVPVPISFSSTSQSRTPKSSARRRS